MNSGSWRHRGVAQKAMSGYSWTMRVHVGANTNEAMAVNVFATGIDHLFAGEPAAPTDQGAAGIEAGGAVSGPVNVMTAIDANSSVAKIDAALKSVTDQQVHYAAARTELTALTPDDALTVLPTGVPAPTATLAVDQLLTNGETALPTQLQAVDASGNVVATYVAAQAQTRTLPDQVIFVRPPVQQ